MTAEREKHPNDPHRETPGRVRQVALPPAARALSILSHVDYEDAFLVETGPAQTGARLIRHARYFILQLAESYLMRRLSADSPAQRAARMAPDVITNPTKWRR